jgi:phasin
MSKSPFEVPSEMRDLAARSVEQARKAFETFIGAAQKASDAMTGGGNPIQKNMADASKMTVTYAEKNMNAAFDMAERLVQAKTIEEAMKIQTEFMQAQAHALQAQMQEAGTKMKAQFDDATAQVQGGMSKAAATAKDNMEKATAAFKPAPKKK